MTAILDGLEKLEATSDGRFSIDNGGPILSQDMHSLDDVRNFPMDFYLLSCNLFPEDGASTVFQTGVSSSGELTDFEDGELVVTVGYEFTQSNTRRWRMTFAGSNSNGRDEFLIDVDEARALRRHFDTQGTATEETELTFFPMLAIMASLDGILRSPKYKEHVNRKLASMKNRQDAIARFCIGNISKLDPRKLNRERALQEKNVERSKFTPTRHICLEQVQLR